MQLSLRCRRPARGARRGAARPGSGRARPPESLYALASAPTAIARALLDDVVSGDARLAWRGRGGRARVTPGAATALEAASFVVFDLETTGLSPATLAHRRDRRPAGRGARGRRDLRDARQPRRAVAGGDHVSHRHRPGRRAAGPRLGPRRAALSLVRRRRGARRPQRALRHGLPRSRRRAPHRAGGSPPRSSTRSGSRGGC